MTGFAAADSAVIEALFTGFCFALSVVLGVLSARDRLSLRVGQAGMALLVLTETVVLFVLRGSGGGLWALAVPVGAAVAVAVLTAYASRGVGVAPGLRVPLGLAYTAVYIVTFAVVYRAASHPYSSHGRACFQHNGADYVLTRIDALYFTLTTAATVGFGDVVPATQACRALVSLQIATGFVVVGVVLVLLLGQLLGEQKRGGPDSPT